MATISWNDRVRLIFSDVDETVADLYSPADPALVRELERVLEEGRVLVLISGQSVDNIEERVVSQVVPRLRRRVLVGPCSGVELWGYDGAGERGPRPAFSACAERLSEADLRRWRQVVNRLIEEFRLQVLPTMKMADFRTAAGDDPLAIMLDDRGAQITLEVVNAHDLSAEARSGLERELEIELEGPDLRLAIAGRAIELLREAGVPVTARLAGVFAVDLAMEGVSKATAVRNLLRADGLLRQLGLDREVVREPERMEVWGDKFSLRGGTDQHMSEALPPRARSITFRAEDPSEFPAGFNICVWDGRKHLHEGLLEFLQSR